jgi:galactokinase
MSTPDTWFEQCYGGEPEGVWQAPGRVNLIGEHTDYNEGFVLPFALAQGVVAAASRRDDGMLVLASRQAGGDPAAQALASLAPGSVTGWAAYPAGVAWALREAGYPVGGASIAIDADLDPGAGLSSSAALECATALALVSLYGFSMPRPEIAALARRGENDFAGIPTGIMDQSASLLCQAGHALLLDCRSGQTSLIPLDLTAAGLILLVIDTRVRRSLSDGRYADRRRDCEEAARVLGVASLRDITQDDLDHGDLNHGLLNHGPGGAHLDPALARRVRHVVTENSRVLQTVDLLRAGHPRDCGPLLTASHVSLRDNFEISWPQADAAVEAAIGAGALGARMTGGGFGGSVIALTEADRSGAVRAAVSESFARRGWEPPGFTDVLPSPGARRLR